MATTRATIPSLEELRDKILRDIKRGKIRAGIAKPNVSPGSESYIKAEAIASSVLEMHAKIAALQDATMPDSAEGEDLDRLANMRGLKRSVGAGASGYVKVSVTGTVVFAAGQEGTFEDGVRAKVVVTTSAINNGLVPIECIDVGVGTNKSAGTVLTWTSPPSGSATTCAVDDAGLTGGKAADTDAALRARLLDLLRHPAQSGSWADVAGWAEASSPSVEKAFVYPALEGPATCHVAITQAAKQDTYYSREASATLVNIAALEVVANMPEHVDVLTTTVTDVDTAVVLSLTLPDHAVDGGTGGGWLDAAADRWPALGTASIYATRLSAVPLSPTKIRVTTYSAPVADAHIAIWSNSHKCFQHTRIKTSTFISGTTYELVLYTAIDTHKIASGDYVSPDAEKLDDYGTAIAEAFAALGPGEKTSSASLLPRSYRHPLTSESWNHKFTSKHVGMLSTAHNEISHVSVNTPTLPATPAIASAVTDSPNILVLGKLAFYPA
jgi:uncharacterized phage protein gp47/JayE